VLSVGRVGGVLVLVKAVDVVARGPVELPAPAWAAVLGLFAGGGAVLLAGPAGRTWSRGGWAAVLAGAAGLAVDLPLELLRQHLVLVMGVALIGLVTRDDSERLLLWRVQLSALYGVAALSKLNESFLGGDVLAGAVVAAPAWSSVLAPPPPVVLVLAGVGLIAVEVALAVAPWVARLRRPGTALAVAFHSATLVLVTNDPLVGLRLVVFGGTAVLLHAASASLLKTDAAPKGGVSPRRGRSRASS
jgi:hypothetical protein